MRFFARHRFSLARAAALAAAWACSSATSFGGNLYTENFNSYSGTQNANQVTTGLPVAHTGTVTGWNRSGAGTIHAVRVATGDWAPMFYEGSNAAGNNIITTASTIALTNTANQTYRVTFQVAPGVYANINEATGSTDGVVLSLLTGANATITSGTFLPGAFSGQASSGNLPFQNAAFDYVGTGSDSGALRLQFAANNAGQSRFGGTVDNVNIVTTALWNNGTSGNWSTAGNWRSGAIPVNSDLVLINGTSGGTSTNDISNLTIAGLEFMSGAGSFTVSGNALTLSDGVTNAGNSSQTLATNLILGGTTRVFRTVGNLTVSGVISNGSGSPGLTKNGTGTLTLSGNNTYNGTTTLNAGTVVISHANGLGTTGNITFSGGGLQYGSGITQDLSSRIKNSGSAILVDTNSNNVTFASAVDSTNSGGLTKNGTGTLTLTGNNTYSGNTTINAGTIEIGAAGRLGAGTYAQNITNNGTLIYSGTNNQTLSGVISGTGALTHNASSTLVLTGTNTYNGTTTINAGTLQIGNNSSASIASTSIVNNANLVYSTNIASGTTSLASSITGTGNLTATAKLIKLNGDITQSGNVTLTASTAGGLFVSGFDVVNDTTITAGNITMVGDGMRGAGWGGNLTLNTSATNGAINLDISTSKSNAWYGLSSFTANAGTGTLTISGTNAATGSGGFFNPYTSTSLTGALNISTNLNMYDSANANRVSGLTLTATGASSITGNITLGTNTASTWTVNPSVTMTVSGILSGSNASITKAGTGILTLSGNNTYNGTTTINAGTVQISSTGLLGGGSYAANIANSGTFIIGANSNQTLSGVISGTGVLTKNGTGTLTLSNAANTYNGSTTVNAGTLAVSGNISSSALTLSSGGVISAGSAAAVAKFNAASLTISGDSGYAFTIGNISGGAAGTAGTDYDQIATSGAITFNNTVNNPFTIYINGTPTNWSSSGSYTWNILSGASISGFSAANFVADTASFGGSLASGASWTFGTSGGNLTLTYGTSGTPTWAGGTGVWSGNFTPSLSNNLNMLFTGAGGVATNDIASGTLSSVGSITFNSTAGSYTLAANSGSAGNGTALTLAGSIINNSASAQTINTALSFGATRTINTASGNITIGGAISGAGGLTKTGNSILSLGGNNTFAGATTISAGTLEVTSTGLLGGGNYSQDIANSGSFIFGSNSNQTLGGIISGSGALTKNGTGTLSLSGVNTYTGATTINAGTLEITSTGQFGSGTYSQNIGNSGTFVLGSNSNQTLSGIISGTGALTKNGTGTLSLSGNNTYTGATTINAGTVQITSTGLLGGGNYTGNIVNSGSLILSSSNAQILGGNISGSGAITKNGSGTLTLSGNNTYSGGTTITAGTLGIGSNSSLGTGAVVFNTPSTAFIDSSAGTTYTISNNITLTNGLSVALGYATGSLIFNGIISGSGDFAINQTSGAVTLNGLNTFTGNISAPRAPSLSFNTIANAGVASALGAGSSIGTGAGSFTSGLIYTGNVAASTNRTISMGGGGLVIRSDSAALTWTGNITASSIPLYLQGTAGGGANFNELSGAFLGGSSLIINAVSGNDVWRISGNNTHTGLTQVTNTSTMIAANANAFGTTAGATQVDTSGQLLLTGGIAVGAEALTLNSNASGTWNGYTGAALRSISGNNSWAGNITLSQASTIATDSGSNLTISGGISGTFNLTVNSTGNTTLSGIIGTSTGTLTKNGTGTLTLSGNNTFTGDTTINVGTIEIGAAGRLNAGSYAGNITNSGVLIYSGTNNQTLSGIVSGTGALTQNAASTLSLSGANTYTGTTTINAGTLQIGAGGTTGSLSSSSAITNNATLAFNRTNTLTQGTDFGSTISGTGNVIQAGSGTTILSGANTYTGTTTVNAGTLQIGAGGTTGSLSTSSAITNNGTIVINRSNTVTQGTDFANSITGAGNLTQSGAGTLVLGTNTYTGATTVNGGTLQLTGNISSSALTLANTGVVSIGTTAAAAKYNASSITIQGGSGYAFTIGNVNSSVAGTDYDQLTATGALTLSNTAANPFTVYISGTPTGWSNSGTYSWNIISAASMTGFSSGNFGVNLTGFGISATNRTGTWTFTNSATAITLTYAAATPDYIWSGSTGNWSTGFTPTAPVTDKNLVFTGSTGTATNDIGNGTLSSINFITFNSTAGAYTLAANAGSAGASGGTALTVKGDIVNYSSSTQTINMNMAFGSSSSGGIDTNAGNITISGVISGTGALNKSGNSTLLLTGNNTYTGVTTITAGTLQIGNNSSASIASTSIVNNANLVYSTNISSGTTSLASSITGTGNLTATAKLIKLNGNITQSGNVILTASTAGGAFASGFDVVNDTTITAGNITMVGDGMRGAGWGGNLTLNTSATNGAINLDISLSKSSAWYGLSSFTANAGTGTLTISGTNAATGSNGFFNPYTSTSLTGALNISTNLNMYDSGNPTRVSGLGLTATGASSITGNITLGPNTASTWTVNPSVTMTVSGILSGSNASITKNGTGILTLSGNNTYNGTTTINGGTLEIGGAGRLGGGSYAGAIALNGTGSTLSYNSTAAQTLSGTKSGNGSIVKNGSGNLTISGGASSFSGVTTVNSGTLNIAAGAALSGGSLVINSGATAFGTGAHSFDSGITSITINGGTYLINDANSYVNAFNGALIMNSGTVNGGASGRGFNPGSYTLSGNNTINHFLLGGGTFNVTNGTTTIWNNPTVSGNSISTITSAITKNGSGTLSLIGNSTYTGVTTLNNGTLGIGAPAALGTSTLTIVSGTLDNLSGAAITLTNNNTQNWNGDFAFTGTRDLNLGTGAVTMNASRTVTITAGNLTVGGAIAGTGFGLTKNGTGTLVLSGANTYNGTTTINAGTLEIGAAGRLGAGTYAQNITNNGTLVYSGTNAQTLSGVISGTGNLTQNASSTLTLSGNNTYTGTTTINAGTITLGVANSIANTSDLNVAGGTFNLAGFNEALGSITGSGNITLGAGTLTTNSSSSTTFSGLISGTGGLTKAGTGTLTLSGNNTYNGTTSINAGTVVIGHANALGTTGNITFSGAGLQYGSNMTADISSRIKNSGSAILVDTNGNNVTFASAVDSTNSGGFTKNGTGTLTFNATNTYTGSTTINAGTLQIASAGLLGSGNYSGNIANSGSFVFASNSNQTLSGNISGTGSLTKNGSGVLTLTGTSSFNGATTINSGTLVVNGSAANSAVTIGNTGVLGGNGTVGALTVQSGGRVGPGNSPGNFSASTLTLEGGGGYNWEIANVTGTAGTDWDFITVGGGSGAATINATSGNKFTIYISGNPVGWNTNNSYNWNIIDWGTVTGFDANAFAVDTTGFTGTAPIGTWAFSNTGGFLNLAYTAGDPTWNGASGNWSTDFMPALTTGNKSITFAGAAGGTSTNDIASGTVGSVAGITFNSTAGAYTLAANSGSAGFNTASALQLNGNIVNNSTATQTINKALTSTATRVYDAAAGNLTMGGVISGTGGLTKNGSNLLTLSANNTYTGDTTINAGTIQITTTGLLGGGNYSANITNNGALVFGSNSNQTLSGIISGTGALTKNGTGTLTLAGNNNYTGNTTINTGTVVIGHANAAGTGKIFQTDGTSILKIDTTGTITNNMSVYNVLASQSATLSGAITVNNATWDVETGDTLTITGVVSGNGGVTKNGGGTLVLSGNNTYAAPTVVNAGTLNATSAGALGSNKTATVNGGTLRLSHANALSANSTVQVNGGTLLVGADDAINGMNITLNGTSTEVATLSFTSNYSGKIGLLTLSANSIIDMGAAYNVGADFADLAMGLYNTLRIYNWTGTTLWGGGTGADPDRIYFGGGNLTTGELSRISFYSGFDSGFLGTGFDLGFQSGFANQIIPVPEPETWATGILLVLGGGVWFWRKRRNFTTEFMEKREESKRIRV